MAISRICSIPECDKPARARGWCNAHWERWRAHGDPLGGQTTRGEPPRYLREVVLTYDGDECLIWPYAKVAAGYGQIRIDGHGIYVHRLACEEQHGPAPTPDHEAAHSCGNGHLACVTKRHLLWKTRSGNMSDKIGHDTHKRGERQWQAKLTEADIHSIRAMPDHPNKIASIFGISRTTVWDIKRGRTWGWLV